ncbi:CGNR zinc finger domain-containing protein [Kribbella sp. NPDC006257]|uniref:CGNR zinc finger domain-containing protein n=1 Tax=Kribbella sp. NPDC006257 TaxID=3156738 RepID=UPI00339EFA12
MSKVPATDPSLAFVLDLCNTHDLLEDPPDRLTIPLVDHITTHHGLPLFGLTPPDLEPLRSVRSTLYAVFATNSVPHQTDLLNHLFTTHAAVPRLLEGVGMAAVGGEGAVGKLAVLAADVLARVIAEGSADRLRTCVGDPCRCVYVDRTKANRQRYCCELCNDRMASAAYRRRNR